MDELASVVNLLEDLGAPIGCRIPKVDAPAIEFSSIVAPPLKKLVSSTVPAPEVPITSPPAVDYLEPFSSWEDFKNIIYNNCNAAAWSNTRRIMTSKLGAREIYPGIEQVQDFYKTQNPNFTGEGNAPFVGDNGMKIQTGLEYLVKNGGPDENRALAFARVDVTKPEAVKLAIAIFGTLWVGLRIYSQTLLEFKENVPWKHPKQPTQKKPYGHAAVVGAYDSNYHIITWGKQAILTPEYWNGTYMNNPKHPNVFDAYVVIWPEHVGTRRFMNGVNLKQLTNEFRTLTKTEMELPESPFNSLYRCSRVDASNTNLELQICDALNSYAVGNNPISTSILQADTSNGTLVTEYKDLYLIQKKNTVSHMIEVQCAASPDFSKVVTWISGFSAKESNNGVWTIDNGTLYFIKTNDTSSGNIEVWWATRQDKFSKPKSCVTGLTKGSIGFGTFAISGDNLYQIIDAENDTGFVQILSVKAYAKYSAESIQHYTTAFVINDVEGKGSWTIGQNGDLYLIKTMGTASGLVEVHVATNASSYQSLHHFSTGFKADGTGLWIL